MKKLFAIVMAAAMILSLTACGGGSSSAKYKVGVCQLVQHPALDAATQGFIDVLEAEFGSDIKIDNQNASNDIPTCTTIVNGFVSNDYDLILANATPALQAAMSATDEIPVLGTSITDYATALEIDNWTGTVGTNISGTSDLAPLEQQAEMVKEWFPDANTVGLLYCSAEANSQYQVDVIEGCLTQMGYTCQFFAFTDSNDVASVAQAACDASDVIYIPTDNTAAENTEAIANVVIPSGVPVIAGEENLCSGCGVATLSIDYYELGQITGQMAVKILKGEADVSDMPIEFAPSVTRKYNEANCQALNLTAPDGYIAIEE